MGHIIWQFVKWFVIGVVAILAVLGLGSEGLLFFWFACIDFYCCCNRGSDCVAFL